MSNANAARDSAMARASSLTGGDRMVAAALLRNAELDVIRKHIAATTPGGEAAYWRFVEQELKR